MKMLLLIALVPLILMNGCANKDYLIINNEDNEIKVNIEIADSDSERTQGLMFRESLDKNSGMLFVFEDEDYHSFWMKNTLIPLDMIFISKNLKIVDIKHAVPCDDECISYKPKDKAKYVLEVNNNFAIENNINLGDKVILK
ncbi:DUF192 domain-containing protein [Candidatus Woesearchaeota archaeon]|nr:DUF192 domain-containing protein [Candidatus Woesearchaeota archaeon]